MLTVTFTERSKPEIYSPKRTRILVSTRAFSLPNDTGKTFAGDACWMAPEVIEQTTGYNHKADIWSFGITAIELATGRATYSHLSAAKVMIAVLNNPSPTLEVKGSSGYSKSFKMIGECLRKDPTKRPTADEILKHHFFKKAKDHGIHSAEPDIQTPSTVRAAEE
ncbi:serine/threonine-protein kinase OSR1-like [Zophobas morio]|uniref:serine/threonine-protein kinase OSR1-like n=1 Tax=Zophobas morio TaxID=2755281 RepID=UPI003083D774